MRIVLDCAHGVAYHIAPHVFHELGADVITIGTEPDGFNINEGVGTTHPRALQQAVKRNKADLGIALDGDGDRLLMADGEGVIHDGDELIYVIARHQRERGELKGGIVGTQMTNLGLEHALDALGIEFVRARVGDRYILEMLHERGWRLGGENSGHIVCLERHTTGDGIISALQVLRALRESATPLAQSVADVKLYPQVLINVKLTKRFDFRNHRAVKEVVAQAEKDLGAAGRVLLRESGTEPVIRVMVEGRHHSRVKSLAQSIADAVRAAV